MAKVTIVELVDDTDGTKADETVRFGLDGVEYTIDLTAKNADKFRGLFQDYIAVATKVGGRKKAATTSGKSNTAEIRAWAKEQGYDVPDRGRLPKEVMEAWDAK